MAVLLSERYREWEKKCEARRRRLKQNEEELNAYFIEQYGLENELDPFVAEKDITIRSADTEREIKSLISYAVGCIFGRYSLDHDGLCYAGGEWDSSLYKTVIPCRDNVIPIGADIFENDLTAQIVSFIEKVYGSETLAENLEFIAEALGGKDEPVKVIGKYLANGFFYDHCKIYHKRPIYWMFFSGKKMKLRAICYMHRWTGDTPKVLREQYIIPLMANIIKDMLETSGKVKDAGQSEKQRLKRYCNKLSAQLEELEAFSAKLQNISAEIDLDDGVKHNYAMFQEVLERIK